MNRQGRSANVALVSCCTYTPDFYWRMISQIKPREPGAALARYPRTLVVLLVVDIAVFVLFWNFHEWFSEPPAQRRTVAQCLAGECEGIRVNIEAALVPGSLRHDLQGCAGTFRLQPPGGGESLPVCGEVPLSNKNFHCGDEEMKAYMNLGYLRLGVEGTFLHGVLLASTVRTWSACVPQYYKWRFGTPDEIIQRSTQ